MTVWVTPAYWNGAIGRWRDTSGGPLAYRASAAATVSATRESDTHVTFAVIPSPFQAAQSVLPGCFPVGSMHFVTMEGFIRAARRIVSVLCAGLFVFCASAQGTSAPVSVPIHPDPLGPAATVSNAVALGSPTFNGTPTSIAGELDLDDTHLLRAGDKVSFRVFEDGEEAKVLTVADSGEIELPLNLGRFNAANKTCKALARDIKVALERNYYKRASVQLSVDTKNVSRGNVYVTGQVTKPGIVTIPADGVLKLSHAIVLVGPTLQWAKTSAIRVMRKSNDGKTDIFTVNLDEINKGRFEKDVTLQAGDTVVVPERGVIFGG